MASDLAGGYYSGRASSEGTARFPGRPCRLLRASIPDVPWALSPNRWTNERLNRIRYRGAPYCTSSAQGKFSIAQSFFSTTLVLYGLIVLSRHDTLDTGLGAPAGRRSQGEMWGSASDLGAGSNASAPWVLLKSFLAHSFLLSGGDPLRISWRPLEGYGRAARCGY